MIQFVTITSQGQITIPAHFRRVLGLQKKQKAMIIIKGDELVIKPEVDILDLEGSLAHLGKKNKGKTIDEILKMEKEGVEEAVVERYQKKQRRSANANLLP